MIDRAHAGRKPPPQRRMQGRRRIEDDGPRNHLRVAMTELALDALVGCAASGRELARRKRRGYGDLPDAGTFVRPRGVRAVRIDDDAKSIEIVDVRDVVVQGEPQD